MVEGGSRDRVLTPDWSSHARLPRDVTNCGPEDTPPPNRVNTSEQLRLVRGKMEEVSSRDIASESLVELQMKVCKEKRLLAL